MKNIGLVVAAVLGSCVVGGCVAPPLAQERQDAAPGSATVHPSDSSFTVTKDVDPLTDVVTHTIGTQSDDEAGWLMWTCTGDDGPLIVLFNFGKLLMANRFLVAYRFPGQLVVEQPWGIAVPYGETAQPRQDIGDTFTQHALVHPTVLLRAVDDRMTGVGAGESVTMTFSLTGLAEALASMPCGKTPVPTR